MKKYCVIILLLVAFAPSAFAQRNAVFPWFAIGDGWAAELFFANQGLSTVSGIQISFYDENGTARTVQSSLGTGSSFEFSLGVGATTRVTVTPGSTFSQGYVVVVYPEFNSPVRATQIIRYVPGGIVTAELGIPQQEQGDHFSFPVVVNSGQGTNTSMAFSNPAVYSSASETVVVSLINANGTVQDVTTVELQPGQYRVGYVNEPWLFPGMANNFVGTLSVSSPLGVGAVAFRWDQQVFGAISTDGGPVLGPFALTGPIIAEQEPNDSDLDAQQLTGSAIINGVIGDAADEDIYSFDGQAGDIVSIICDAPSGENSYLDCYLELFDFNWNPIAVNDQNGLAPGLYPQNDSFIQMKLPADDIYFIVVSDYWFAGGLDYPYSLHVKLQ